MDIWSFIIEHIESKKNIILITVVECKGSSPGRVGFKMAVSSDGSIAGSIGGGVMEYNMVELARKKLIENCSKPFIKRQIHNSEAEFDKSGMICSGEQTQVFTPLSFSDLNIVSSLKETLDKGFSGCLNLSPNHLSFSKEVSIENQFSCTINSSEDWQYSERLGFKDTVYIFGAGHISVPLSQILRMLDFRVVVYDNRTQLSTFNSNTFANQKEVVDYNNVGHLVPEGPNSYAAIMTFGHKFDQVVLKQLLPKHLKYLGMIGSKNKVLCIYENLREFGFNDADFARVDSPIGISIKSQTPVEIAISIVAKIIQVRNS
jgi:xanthine dehydrogenase accessory factor